MRRPLVLLGAGGLARETTELVRAHNAHHDLSRRHRLVGLLDDDPTRQGRLAGGLAVLGPRTWLETHPETDVVICVAHPRRPLSRLAIARSLTLAPDRYPTLIHPAAHLSRTTRWGVGTILHAGVTCTADVVVGSHVVIMPGAVLTHDVSVADGATLASGVLLAGGVHIDEGAYVGAGALIREGCRIGVGATVGMGAVVTSDIEPGSTYVGNPARPIRRSHSDIDSQTATAVTR